MTAARSTPGTVSSRFCRMLAKSRGFGARLHTS
nr:MAG TPA: hypothetical protein [Caudoviricetes sp.]